MKLYDYHRSTASYRVRIALHLKNIRYEALPINLTPQADVQHQSEYLSLNPQGLVPLLDENGHIISQSMAIMEYLEEICPTPPILPHTPLERAQVRSLAMIIVSDIHPLNNLRVLQQLRQQFGASEEQITEWYHLWLTKGFDAIEARLQALPRKHPVCFGHEVSLADICLIPQVYNANRFEFPLDKYPLIRDINEYCLTLRAFHEAAP